MDKKNKYKVYIIGFDVLEIEASWYKVENDKLVFEDVTGTIENPLNGMQMPVTKIKAIVNHWTYVEVL